MEEKKEPGDKLSYLLSLQDTIPRNSFSVQKHPVILSIGSTEQSAMSAVTYYKAVTYFL